MRIYHGDVCGSVGRGRQDESEDQSGHRPRAEPVQEEVCAGVQATASRCVHIMHMCVGNPRGKLQIANSLAKTKLYTRPLHIRNERVSQVCHLRVQWFTCENS